MATTPLANPASLFCGVADNHRLMGWLGPLNAVTPEQTDLTAHELAALESALLERHQRVLGQHWPAAVPGAPWHGGSTLAPASVNASPVYALWQSQLRFTAEDSLLLRLIRQLAWISQGQLLIQVCSTSEVQPAQSSRLGQCALAQKTPAPIGKNSYKEITQWRLIWRASHLDQMLAQSDMQTHRLSIGSRWLTCIRQTHTDEQTACPPLALVILLPAPTAANGLNPRGIPLTARQPPALGLHTAWCAVVATASSEQSIQIRRNSPAYLGLIAT